MLVCTQEDAYKEGNNKSRITNQANLKPTSLTVIYLGLMADYTRLLVPKKLTLPSVFTKQCGVVLAMVGRWHHLVQPTVDHMYTSIHLSSN